MKKRILGKTGLEVSELALGGLFVSRHGGALQQGIGAIKRALQHGINYIDTAPGYENSEEVIGKALEGDTTPLVISTKLGGRPTPFNAQDKSQLMQSFEESLRLLKRDRIDILMIHEPDRPGQYTWWTDFAKVQGPVMEVMAELKKKGLVRFTGLGGTSAYDLAHLMRSEQFDVVLTAFNYSVLWREAEQDILPTAKQLGMGVVIGSPLQQGALAKRYDEQVNGAAWWLTKPRRAQLKVFYDYLDELGMPLPELALRFVMSNPDVACALTGARSAQEVDENVAAADRGPLPRDVLKRLDEIHDMLPFRPSEEPFCLSFGGCSPLGSVR